MYKRQSDDNGLTIDMGTGLSPELPAENRNSATAVVVESDETTQETEPESTNAERDAYYANQFTQIDDSDEDSRDRSDWLNDLFAGDWESYL